MSEQEQRARFSEWCVVEEWRPVVEYEGQYQVSNLGRVRRVGGRVLKDQPADGGYRKVQLWHAGLPQNFLLHVVVATAWLGWAPPGHEVNHKDGVKSHNAPSNLEYLTRPQNLRHAYATGLRRVTLDAANAVRRKPRSMVACACGCGQQIETPDHQGRPRRFAHGHNFRRTA